MAINIKNEETSLLVSRLATLTGVSVTEAIRKAVEEKLDRMLTSDQQIERILAIGRDCASRLPEHLRTSDHGDLLYGSDGLPK